MEEKDELYMLTCKLKESNTPYQHVIFKKDLEETLIEVEQAGIITIKKFNGTVLRKLKVIEVIVCKYERTVTQIKA